MAVGSVSESKSKPSVSQPKAESSAKATKAPASTPEPKATPSAPKPPSDTFEKAKVCKAPVELSGKQAAAVGDAGGGAPARTKEQALKEADAVLRGPTKSEPGDVPGTVVTRDPPHVNDVTLEKARTGNLSAEQQARVDEARKQVEANQALVDEKLKALAEKDRQNYAKVRETVKDNPLAELSLQKGLLEDKLTGSKDLRGQGNALEHLAKLADSNTKLAEGIDRPQLVADVVSELATPTAIAQHYKNTCAPTIVSEHLAMNNPAEYARLVGGLASESGKVGLAGNPFFTLNRVAGTAADDGSGRSISQRLLEPALQDYGNSPLVGFDNAKDGHTINGNTIPVNGMNVNGALGPQVDAMLDGIYGKDHGFLTPLLDPISRKAGMAEIDLQLNAGKTALATIQYGGDSLANMHKIMVTGTKTVDGQQYVTYVNPWGREEMMPREQFEKGLREVNYQKLNPLELAKALGNAWNRRGSTEGIQLVP